MSLLSSLTCFIVPRSARTRCWFASMREACRCLDAAGGLRDFPWFQRFCLTSLCNGASIL